VGIHLADALRPVRTCVWQAALLLRFNSGGVGLLKTAKPVCFPLIYDPSTLSLVSQLDHLWVLPYTWRPQPALGSGRDHRVTQWSEDAFHNNFKTLRWPSILSKLPGFCHPRRCTVKEILRGFRKSNYMTSRFKRWRTNVGLLWFSSHAVLTTQMSETQLLNRVSPVDSSNQPYTGRWHGVSKI